MSMRTNLVKARSHIIFIIALLLGVALIVYLEGAGRAGGQAPDPLEAFAEVVPLPLADGLGASAQTDEVARIAWTYFENNTQGNCTNARTLPHYSNILLMSPRWLHDSEFMQIQGL